MKKLLMSALMLGAFGLSFAGNPIKDGEPEKKESTKSPLRIIEWGYASAYVDGGYSCPGNKIGCIGENSKGRIMVNIGHSLDTNVDNWKSTVSGSSYYQSGTTDADEPVFTIEK